MPKLNLAGLGKYKKFAVAAAGFVAVVAQAYSDGHITTDEWIGIGIAAVTAYGVWQLPNKQPDPQPAPPAPAAPKPPAA